MMDTMKISDAISGILAEFTTIPDGDKQNYNVESSEYYQGLSESDCDLEEVRMLVKIIDELVGGYRELCDQFGDKF